MTCKIDALFTSFSARFNSIYFGYIGIPLHHIGIFNWNSFVNQVSRFSAILTPICKLLFGSDHVIIIFLNTNSLVFCESFLLLSYIVWYIVWSCIVSRTFPFYSQLNVLTRNHISELCLLFWMQHIFSSCLIHMLLTWFNSFVRSFWMELYKNTSRVSVYISLNQSRIMCIDKTSFGSSNWSLHSNIKSPYRNMDVAAEKCQ